MRNILSTLFLLMFVLTEVSAQDTRQFNQIDEDGNVTQRSENRNFNKNSNDTTKNKEIPKGHFAWTIDRRFGDVIPADKDTIHHLFMNTTFNTGMHGEFNTTGNNSSSDSDSKTGKDTNSYTCFRRKRANGYTGSWKRWKLI